MPPSKRSSLKITAARLDTLKQGSTLWDTEVRGFGARRGARGVTFIFKRREPIHGKQILMTIGPHGRGGHGIDDARRIASEWSLRIINKQDPRAKPDAAPAAPMTVSQLCDAYVEALPTLLLSRAGRPKKTSTIATDKSRIEAHIKPLLGKLLVTAATSADVDRFIEQVANGKTAKPLEKGRGSPVKGGKGAASRTVGLLGAIFSFAVRRQLRPDNPVRGVVRFADTKRDRRLSDAEYKALGVGIALASEARLNIYGIAAMRFLALTGWRLGEVTNLKWTEIDRERRTAMLGDTKTGRSMRPLAKAVLDVLTTMKPLGKNPYAFPATTGDGPIGGFPRYFIKMRTKADLPDDITAHVLRHSFASVASDSGLSEATIAALLGHKSGTVTSRYIHSADAVLLAAADTVADKILTLMNGDVPKAPSDTAAEKPMGDGS